MYKRIFWLLALFAGPASAADGDSGILSSLLKIITDFAGKLWDKLTGFSEWILSLVKGLIEAVWDIIKDAFAWAFEQVLELLASIISTMYTQSGADSLIAQVTGAWASMPPEVSQVTATLGLGTAMTMIASALVIRILLQLIPFTRLGS